MKMDTFDRRTLDLGWSRAEIEVMIKSGFTARRTGNTIRLWRHEDDARAYSVRVAPSTEAAKLWTHEFNQRVRKEQRS